MSTSATPHSVTHGLWLIRHGETEWSKSGKHTSTTDLALTAEGERLAFELGQRLQGKTFAVVLSSPMKRALETCRLAGFGDHAEISADLKEWNYGQYEGRTTPEIQKENPGWTIWTGNPPGGETAAQVAARADRVIERAMHSLDGVPQDIDGVPEGDVAIFAHGHFLRVLAARWLGLDPTAGKLLALSTGSVSVLGFERQTRVIQRWNDAGE
jgi:probable phosphoglycerate mutase